MSIKSVLIAAQLILATFTLSGQDKWDYQWMFGGSSLGEEGVLVDFNTTPITIMDKQIGMQVEGSNTSMCDRDGNLLFYTNGCFIANVNGEVMESGDSINTGFIQQYWCPFGGCPMTQGTISLPAPGSDSLYYVFNLDLGEPYPFGDPMYTLAPLHLYYHLIDMSKNGGLGAVVAKNQVAVQDSFARGTVQAVRHANGVDWWVAVPELHTNCYFVTLVSESGVQPPVLECAGEAWNDDDGAQAVFTPDTKKYARMNFQNGLHIYDFDNETGQFSNPYVYQFPINSPNDSFPGNIGLSISPNSRYLYSSANTKLYQFDLEAADIGASRVLVAEWDGFSNPFPTIFNLSALAPDGKIYIASTSSTYNLHVIHNPDCPGLNCEVEQHGIELPSDNFISMPNFPHYRNQPSSIICDSISLSSHEVGQNIGFKLFPNPTSGMVTVELEEISDETTIEIYDLLGRKRLVKPVTNVREVIDLSTLEEGIYIIKLNLNKNKATKRKIVKIN